MTFYKYAERKVENEIDWGQISKDLSDSLSEENKLREEKKDKVDAATNQVANTLANYPVSQSSDINAFTARSIDEIQKARLMQDRLLKSGKLPMRDYLLQRQNLTEGINTLYSSVKNIDNVYKQGYERISSGKASNLELQLRKHYEQFTNLGEYGSYISPTDGIVYMGKRVKNPQTGQMEVSTSPNNLMSVPGIDMLSKIQVDKFDVDKYVEGKAGQVGAFAEALRKGGIDITTKSIKDNPRYNEVKGYAISELTTDPTKIAQVLTENSPGGMQYEITFDPNDKGPNKILASVSGGTVKYSPTEAQKAIVTKYLDDKWEGSVESMVSAIPAEQKVVKATETKVDPADKAKYEDAVDVNYNAIPQDWIIRRNNIRPKMIPLKDPRTGEVQSNPDGSAMMEPEYHIPSYNTERKRLMYEEWAAEQEKKNQPAAQTAPLKGSGFMFGDKQKTVTGTGVTGTSKAK